MARKSRTDRALDQRLDELQEAIVILKVTYDKYFNGLEKFEPIRMRDQTQRLVRELIAEGPIRNTAQRFKFQQLRARWNSMDLYLRRNLSQIERGIHPKFKFRADLKERARLEVESRQDEARRELQDRAKRGARENEAMRRIYDRYIEARKRCGQSTDLEYDRVAGTLRNQVRRLKADYQCNSVSFRVAIEDGKAKLKAIPKR
jgi:hypothetical protein